MKKILHYVRLQHHLTRLITACLVLGYTERAFNLILRKARLRGKWCGLHCYPVYRDFGGPRDTFIDWRTEPLDPGNQMVSVHYRSR